MKHPYWIGAFSSSRLQHIPNTINPAWLGPASHYCFHSLTPVSYSPPFPLNHPQALSLSTALSSFSVTRFVSALPSLNNKEKERNRRLLLLKALSFFFFSFRLIGRELYTHTYTTQELNADDHANAIYFGHHHSSEEYDG